MPENFIIVQVTVLYSGIREYEKKNKGIEVIYEYGVLYDQSDVNNDIAI